MLPIAMLTGALFHSYLDKLAFLTPALIFCMLFITFCKVSPRKMKFTKLHLWLLLIQIAGSIGVYLVLINFDNALAEGVMICILAPTATAAAVITGMLGGSVAFLTSFIFVSNVLVAICGPIIFSYTGNGGGMSFMASFAYIFQQIGTVLLLPLGCAWLVQYFLPRVHKWMLSIQMVSFYLWATGLTIVTAKTVTFLINQKNPDYRIEIWLLGSTFIVCALQFWTGRKIGKKYNNKIAGGQAIGQKNTILAIWMAQVYLTPIASVGPAAYVLWQNLINSWQLWKKRKQDVNT